MIEQTIENNGWPLIVNENVNLNNLDWLVTDTPDGWVTLFSRVFNTPVVPREALEFDRMRGSDVVLAWIKDNGFSDKIKYHIHRTVVIDIDLDAYLVEWHLSFPSDQERIAWRMTMDWDAHMEGWI